MRSSEPFTQGKGPSANNDAWFQVSPQRPHWAQPIPVPVRCLIASVTAFFVARSAHPSPRKCLGSIRGNYKRMIEYTYLRHGPLQPSRMIGSGDVIVTRRIVRSFHRRSTLLPNGHSHSSGQLPQLPLLACVHDINLEGSRTRKMPLNLQSQTTAVCNRTPSLALVETYPKIL